MILKNGEFYCYRIGDRDDYHKNKSILNIKKIMSSTGRLTSITSMGVTTTMFRGNNYISLYVGDKDFQPIREIPKEVINSIFKK